MMTVIRLAAYDVRKRVTVVVHPLVGPDADVSLLNGIPGMLRGLKEAIALVNSGWPKEWSPDILVYAYQTGERLSLHPERAQEELAALRSAISEIVRQIEKLNIPDEKKKMAEKMVEMKGSE